MKVGWPTRKPLTSQRCRRTESCYAMIWESPLGPQISGFCNHPADSSYSWELNRTWRRLTARETARQRKDALTEEDVRRIVSRKPITLRIKVIHEFLIDGKVVYRRLMHKQE